MTVDTSDFRPLGVSGAQSGESSGMVFAMTPTPSPLSAESPASAGGSPEGGVGLVPWFLAACNRCNIDGLEEPFLAEDARDDWAAKHAAAAGHVVFVSIDGGPEPARALRLDENGQDFRFLCVAPKCARWNGPFPSAQVALASARAHVCRVPE